jgi:hypothetical protein
VNLGKNASDTCVMLFTDCEGEAMKKLSVPEWHNSSKGAHMSKPQMKTMLITFFDIKGVVHFEFIPHDHQTVNQVHYVEILKWLHETVCRKRAELWLKWILHDNDPAHKVLSSSSWPKNRLLKWNTHTILLIWLQMTSGCLQK